MQMRTVQFIRLPVQENARLATTLHVAKNKCGTAPGYLKSVKEHSAYNTFPGLRGMKPNPLQCKSLISIGVHAFSRLFHGDVWHEGSQHTWGCSASSSLVGWLQTVRGSCPSCCRPVVRRASKARPYELNQCKCSMLSSCLYSGPAASEELLIVARPCVTQRDRHTAAGRCRSRPTG